MIAHVEILSQHAIVKQQLHVMVFLLVRPVLIGKVALDVEVLACFLLNKQFHVGRHEVNTALQAELLTYKGRFEDGLVTIVTERSARFKYG